MDSEGKKSKTHCRVDNWVNILSWAEAQHDVIVDIHPQGMTGGDCHIDSKIP